MIYSLAAFIFKDQPFFCGSISGYDVSGTANFFSFLSFLLFQHLNNSLKKSLALEEKNH